MKLLCILLATVLAAALSVSAKTLDWPIDATTAGARQFTAYHGETVRFNLQFKGAMTNLSPVAIYYQTNGMGRAEFFPPIPGTVFHPTNDCGAAFYRFFIRCTDPDGINYTANGSLRLLDSPGFVPNEVPFPVKRIDFSLVEVLNPPWPDDSYIKTIATNAAVRATSALFRPFGDEYVYESAGYSDFTWTGERADILAALGDTQPYVDWEDDDYVEWYIDFSIGPTNYWGYAWAPGNSPQVDFWLDGWYWNDETYEEQYDSAAVTGHRTALGYVISNPVDTFAHQSELTTINAGITALRNELNGETKVMRTGGDGEYGTGWGYLQHMVDSEVRRWRIRVPQFGAASGMQTNSAAATASYRTVDDPVAHGGNNAPLVLAAPHTWLPGWDLNRRLVETRGIYGTDAVQLADYRIGLVYRDRAVSDACLLNYDVRHVGTSPMTFTVQADTNGMSKLMVAEDTLGAHKTAWVRYVDYPQLHFRWQTANVAAYTVTNENWLTMKAIGVMGDARASTSNGTIQLDFICVFDAELRREQMTKSNGEVAVQEAVATNVLTTATVTLSCTSATTFENVYAPYYRLVTTHGDENNFYYDAAQDCTWRIAVSNGCFYSEWVMDGDWRRRGL